MLFFFLYLCRGYSGLFVFAHGRTLAYLLTQTTEGPHFVVRGLVMPVCARTKPAMRNRGHEEDRIRIVVVFDCYIEVVLYYMTRRRESRM